MEVSSSFWIGFIILVVVLLSLDMFVFNKKGTVINVKKALWLSLFWISLAMLFNVGVYFVFGKERALEFFTAYLIEESLSVDNLFVFIIIFTTFRIKPEHQHSVLFWGILGAIVFRAIFIFAGVALIERFAWIMYVFGAFLLFTGAKMIADEFKEIDQEKEKENQDPNNNWLVKTFRKFMPVTDDMSKPIFFKKINKRLYATPFFLALLVIEFTDLIFAIDSIPAVLSVSTNTFIIYTSNIFAILGLRSLYFALRGIMDLFYYLKYALSGILVFIGFKMILNHYAHTAAWDFHISNMTSLLVIASFLIISIIASIARSRSAKHVVIKQPVTVQEVIDKVDYENEILEN
ncbi:MAG: TerC family protein [Bacteroidia bacterium]|nr:TerC family protein [Bacteroidia bacterium]